MELKGGSQIGGPNQVLSAEPYRVKREDVGLGSFAVETHDSQKRERLKVADAFNHLQFNSRSMQRRGRLPPTNPRTMISRPATVLNRKGDTMFLLHLVPIFILLHTMGETLEFVYRTLFGIR